MTHSSLRRSRSRDISRACFETLEARQLLTFSAATSFPVGTSAYPQAVATADFNNDGRLDLATANAGFASVSVLLGDGSGGFGAAINSASSTATAFERASIAVADFNNDGKSDAATAMFGYKNNARFGRLDVRLGKGDGTFQLPTNLPTGGAPLAVAAGDFNNNGNRDLVVTSDPDGLYGFVQVLLGSGQGSFAPAQPIQSDIQSGLALGDLNGDGKLDAVAEGVDSSVACAFLGDGAGGLVNTSTSYSTYYSLAVALGDLTGDGVLDLVVAGGGVETATGLGDGFGEMIFHSANGNEHTGVAVADFNGDGKLDVVTSDGDTDTVSLLLGKGDRTLRYIAAFPAGSSPAAVAIADFNGDGRPDVATANAGSNNVSVLINNGAWLTKTYVGPASGNWSAAANWSPVGVPTAGDVVTISDSAVNLPSSATVGELHLTGGASLTLVAAGNQVFRTTTLTIGGTAKLDLNDNDLILDYSNSSQQSLVQALINPGRAGGAWAGSGITSTAAKDNVRHDTTLGAMEAADYKSIYGVGATFDGQSIDDTAVLVKYTYYGDADFNEVVNFDDYSRIDGGFLNNRSGWMNGDFDGNGLVDFDDYGLIDLAFNTR